MSRSLTFSQLDILNILYFFSFEYYILHITRTTSQKPYQTTVFYLQNTKLLFFYLYMLT